MPIRLSLFLQCLAIYTASVKLIFLPEYLGKNVYRNTHLYVWD